ADGAQSSRVPVPLPKDPYEAIRKAYLVETDTESEPFEEVSDSALRKRFRSSYDSFPSLNLPVRKRYKGTSELILGTDSEENEELKESSDSDSESEDVEDKGPTAEDEDPAVEDEVLVVGVRYGEVCGIESDGLGLGEEEAIPEGQQQAVLVVGTAVSKPLGLGRSKRVSAFRQPTITKWTDPKDGMVYIDVPVYPPPAPPIQTAPSPKWTSGSLPISPSPSVVPSPISSPMIPLTIPSHIASPMATSTATISDDEDQFIDVGA
nr:hypothetical protein [Tanacetum cinerariifolium]